MGIKREYNLTATGMEPAGIQREIKVKIYHFDPPAGAKPGDEITVDWDAAKFVHEQTFNTDREFSNAIEFLHSRPTSGVTLISMDDQDLSFLDFNHLPLQGIRMRNCDLTETEFRSSRICGADFSGSNMTDAYLQDAIAGALTQGDSDYTFRFPAAVFDGAKMQGAKLTGGAFQDVSFRATNMQNAQFDRSILRYSDFSNTALEGASFKDTHITGVNFMEAKVTPMQLADAKGTPLCQPGHYACAFKRKSRAIRPA